LNSTNKYWQTPLLMPKQEKAICMESGSGLRAVPRIYLLGQKKCGTTSAAFDMKLAGAQGAFATDPWKKELHTFDKLCQWEVAKRWGEPEWTGAASPGTCPAKLADGDREAWLQQSPFYECDDDFRGVISDLTPVNMRLVGLPATMKQLYGHDADRLAFIVFLREPLARFQSGFYSSRNGSDWALNSPTMASFGKYVSSIRAKVDEHAKSDMQNADRDYSIDEFYRSLYWSNLMPWLSVFSPQQFMIVPMKYYFESTETKLHTLDMMAKQFDAYMLPELAIHNTHKFNQGENPKVESDLDDEDRRWLMQQHFGPDTDRLSGMLADKMRDGLTIAGFTGSPDPKSVSEYLKTHW